jgi:hypothetical protein
MSALAGYKANIYATTTPAVAFTNEATGDAGDHKTFTISNAVKRYWDDTQALTVQTSPDGTTWTTVSSGFTIQAVGGTVIFTNAVTGATPSVRVSGFYLPYSLVGTATSVDITHTVDILDSTTFSSGAWKTKVASLVGSEYKFTKWWIDHFFITALDTKLRFVLSAYSGANANQRFDAYGRIKSDSIKSAVNALVSEDLSFDVDGAVYAYLS